MTRAARMQPDTASIPLRSHSVHQKRSHSGFKRCVQCTRTATRTATASTAGYCSQYYALGHRRTQLSSFLERGTRWPAGRPARAQQPILRGHVAPGRSLPRRLESPCSATSTIQRTAHAASSQRNLPTNLHQSRPQYGPPPSNQSITASVAVVSLRHAAGSGSTALC